MRRRLKKKDITLRELLKVSYDAYKTKTVDDKRKRVKLDLVSGRIIKRRNLEFNFSTRTWEQTNKYGVIFHFLIKSEPISYKRIDKLKSHTYPVIFHFLDLSLGVDSPIKYRTGSEKKWKTTPKGSTTKERQKIAEQNIKNGVQADFLFCDMWVADKFGYLYGRNTTNGKPPLIKNKKFIPYFDKTSLAVVQKILIPILNNKKSPLIGKVFKF